MKHGVSIRHVNIVVERVRGWRAICDCGWSSVTLQRRLQAVDEGRAHLVMVAKRDVPQVPRGVDSPHHDNDNPNHPQED